GYQCELLGRLQLYQKSYSSAEDTFHKASDRDPGMRYRYLGFMAEASARQFNGKTRMQRYITVLQQLPGSGLSYWEARLRLAQGYRARKEYDRAEELLQEILLALPWEGCMHPLITDVYEEQGLLLLARKDKQRALMALEKAQAARGYDAVLSERLRKLKKDTRG
ncbi:MAG: hypothetical protein IKN79_00935, partial [Eubacterium sp.]|nr:hypothetical protein [Eubacterium sp.]